MQPNESRRAEAIVDRLLAAARSGRRLLRAHPADLPSILPNQLAAQGVDWSEIESMAHDASGRPFLRFQRSFDVHPGAVTVQLTRNITTAAARANEIVAGPADGQLLVLTRQAVGAGVPAHEGPVSMLSFAEGNGLLLSGGADGLVRLWPATPNEGSNKTLLGHTSEVTRAMLGGDNRVIAGARDGSIRVWDRESGRELSAFIGHMGPITTLDASPDHSVLLSGSTDCTLRVWDVMSGKLRVVLRAHRGYITGGAFLKSGDTFRVLSASIDGLLKIWNLDGDEVATLGGHSGAVRDLKLVTWLDTPLAVSGGDDGTVRIWDVETALERRVLRGHRGPVTQVAAFGDEPCLVLSASDDGTCRLWDIATASVLHEYRIGASSVTELSVAATGDVAACVTEEGALARLDLSATVAGSQSAPVHIALSKDGDQIFVGAGPAVRLLRIDGTSQGDPLEAQLFGATLDVAMNWTADFYVSFHEGGTVRHWSLSGALTDTHQLPADTSAIGLSPSGSILLSGGRLGILRASRRTSSGWSVLALFEGTTPINACACDMSEVRAVSAGVDGTLRIWDLKARVALLTIAAHSREVLNCDISHDGTFALSASADGMLRVWDVATGSLRATLEGHTAEVTACRIGRRADRAFSCSRDGTVKLWDLVQGGCLETFYGDAAFVSLSIAPGAAVVAVADVNGKVWVLQQVDELQQVAEKASNLK